MYRKYYSYNDMPRRIVPQHSSQPAPHQSAAHTPPQKPSDECCAPPRGGILSNLSNDDLILAVVLLILIMDGCEDKLLLAAIGFVLLGN